MEEVITLLANIACPEEGWLGAEWWIQNRSPTNPLFFHFDADQILSNQPNPTWKFPEMASILYITDTGGPTLILNQRMTFPSESDEESLVPPRPYKGHLIYPKENQYLSN